MLSQLFGSKNTGMVLTFLFIHKTGYGAQISRALATALAPVQKALINLEQVGVLESRLQGKIRLYMFNKGYFLHEELLALVKRAYCQLSPEVKKQYFLSRHHSMISNKEVDEALLFAWEILKSIRFLNFMVSSHSKIDTGLSGEAVGQVSLSSKGFNQLIFSEKGAWKNCSGSDVAFSNSFRWTLDRSAGVLSLEHLRHGELNPVFLFHLKPEGKNSFVSQDAHLCGGDVYFGHAFFFQEGFRLLWRVVGPVKNEELEYRYSTR